jgi:hypothetical protein
LKGGSACWQPDKARIVLVISRLFTGSMFRRMVGWYGAGSRRQTVEEHPTAIEMSERENGCVNGETRLHDRGIHRVAAGWKRNFESAALNPMKCCDR